jgi:PAS domain S-box-containing protein
MNDELRTQAELEREIRRLRRELTSARSSSRPNFPFAKLVRYSSDVVNILDANGTIIYESPAAQTILGYDSEERTGKSAFEFIHEDDHARVLQTYQKLISAPGSSHTLVFRIRHANGSWRTLEAMGRNMLDDPEVRGIVVNSRDITERQRAELAFQDSQKELQRRNAELQQFSYVVSHDLREPLRMVNSFLELLERHLEDSLDETGRQYLWFAVDGARRMEGMIRGLLDYARIETRGEAPVPTNAQKVLEGVLTDLQFEIQERDASVTYDPLPTVQADPLLLARLFQNLITNALKFQPDHDGNGAGTPRVHVGAERYQDKWTFSVRDNGIGIDPKFFDELFQVFRRLHAHAEYEGTGIGLAICKRIVEHHGGRIWVESAPGEGATFYFTLPAAEV